MKPFDLEAALAGKPVVYKDDLTSVGHIVGHSKTFEGHMVVEWDNHNLIQISVEDLKRDFHMYEEPRPTVTLVLPAPLKEPRDEMWYISDWFEIIKSIYKKEKIMSDVDKAVFEEGRYFATKEDAQAWLDAMHNNRR